MSPQSEQNLSNLDRLLLAAKDQLVKMCNPQHPAFKLVIERSGFGYDENRVPQVAEFVMRIEYVSTVAQLPTQGVSGLVLPSNLRGAASTPNGADVTPLSQPGSSMPNDGSVASNEIKADDGHKNEV